jgi:hypothetical protein
MRVRHGIACAVAWSLMVSSVGAEPAATPAEPTGAAPTPAVSSGPSWTLRLPKGDPVAFHGVLSMDQAGGGPGGMAYPAVGGVAGLLVGVLTHSALSGAAQQAEKTRLREQADGVLSPYQADLSTFSHRELMQKALGLAQVGDKKTLLEADRGNPSDWVIDSEPVFYMTQDQAGLILENVVTIRKPGEPEDKHYHNTVRVVGEPASSADLKALWSEGQAAKLKLESEKLLAQSIDLALVDVGRPGGEAHPRKTVRYLEGKTEKMERGEVLDDCCGRLVVRTLRGWVLSVPMQQPAGAAGKVATQ